MSRIRSTSTEAIVLKRSNSGETDRVVTLLSRDRGKFVCIAKGVRSLTSSKRAYLEPGTYIRCQLITTKSMPLMTQAVLVDDTACIHGQLPKIRQLMQLLEIIDRLFVEEQPEEFLFEDVLAIRKQIVCEGPTSGEVLGKLDTLLENLGYQPLKDTQYTTISEYVSVIADQPMRSWDFLKVKDLY